MPGKILIVDDEPDSIDFMASILENHGYDYLTATNGIEGLELARDEKPSLILLDLIMPEKSGITMFRELKKDPELSHVPVIVVSGATEMTGVSFKNFRIKQSPHEAPDAGEGGERMRLTGPEAYVDKPIDPDKLLRAIKENITV
jgi:CheY-like chemotaxis protein